MINKVVFDSVVMEGCRGRIAGEGAGCAESRSYKSNWLPLYRHLHLPPSSQPSKIISWM